MDKESKDVSDYYLVFKKRVLGTNFEFPQRSSFQQVHYGPMTKVLDTVIVIVKEYMYMALNRYETVVGKTSSI